MTKKSLARIGRELKRRGIRQYEVASAAAKPVHPSAISAWLAGRFKSRNIADAAERLLRERTEPTGNAA